MMIIGWGMMGSTDRSYLKALGKDEESEESNDHCTD